MKATGIVRRIDDLGRVVVPKEIRRVLRSGGLLVVADFDRHTQERMRLDYGDLWLGFDEATMARLLHAASFEVVSTTRYPVEQGLALNLTLARRL